MCELVEHLARSGVARVGQTPQAVEVLALGEDLHEHVTGVVAPGLGQPTQLRDVASLAGQLDQLVERVAVARGGATPQLARAGVEQPGHAARSLTDLGSPRVDWVALSTGYGVPARRATTADELVSAMRDALAEPGPHLVEAML